ncbi:MAG: hypothetical protein IPJ57_09480 [Gemmatimonadetes bacterium]|nr:hypothetical protein [Gemmatimonadota bacterium]
MERLEERGLVGQARAPGRAGRHPVERRRERGAREGTGFEALGGAGAEQGKLAGPIQARHQHQRGGVVESEPGLGGGKVRHGHRLDPGPGCPKEAAEPGELRVGGQVQHGGRRCRSLLGRVCHRYRTTDPGGRGHLKYRPGGAWLAIA